MNSQLKENNNQEQSKLTEENNKHGVEMKKYRIEKQQAKLISKILENPRL